MLIAAYLLFVLVGLMTLDAARDGSLGNHERVIRVATTALAALFAAGAALRLEQVVSDADTSWPADRWSFLIPAAVAVGAVTYVAGQTLRGRPALLLRRCGWGLLWLALAVPSTLSLALPLVAALMPGVLDLRSDRLSRRGRPAEPSPPRPPAAL